LARGMCCNAAEAAGGAPARQLLLHTGMTQAPLRSPMGAPNFPVGPAPHPRQRRSSLCCTAVFLPALWHVLAAAELYHQPFAPAPAMAAAREAQPQASLGIGQALARLREERAAAGYVQGHIDRLEGFTKALADRAEMHANMAEDNYSAFDPQATADQYFRDARPIGAPAPAPAPGPA